MFGKVNLERIRRQKQAPFTASLHLFASASSASSCIYYMCVSSVLFIKEIPPLFPQFHLRNPSSLLVLYKHQYLVHLLREFASLNLHVNAMEKCFVLHCHPKKIILFHMVSHQAVHKCYFCQSCCLCPLTSFTVKERGDQVGAPTAQRRCCRWRSCNPTNAVINDRSTWLTLTRVNTTMAEINT